MIKELLKDHHFLHWRMQLERFVVQRAGATPYGRYKQALRGLERRVRGLNGLRASLQRLDNKLARLRSTLINDAIDDLTRADLQVEIEESVSSRPTLVASIADHERERDVFFEIATRLQKEIGGQFPLSPERRTQLDEREWIASLKREAVLELLTQNAVRKNTLSLILTLEPRDRDEAIGLIKSQIRHISGPNAESPGPAEQWLLCEYSPSPKLSSNSSRTDATSSAESSMPNV